MPDAAGTEPLRLKEEFPAVSTQEWEAAIAADLKGADYEKKLIWKTDEGIAVKPYYRSEDLPGEAATRRASAGWEMSEGAAPEGTVDASRWHEQGATSVQELAFAAAEASEAMAAGKDVPALLFGVGGARVCGRTRARATAAGERLAGLQ